MGFYFSSLKENRDPEAPDPKPSSGHTGKDGKDFCSQVRLDSFCRYALLILVGTPVSPDVHQQYRCGYNMDTSSAK